MIHAQPQEKDPTAVEKRAMWRHVCASWCRAFIIKKTSNLSALCAQRAWNGGKHILQYK
jgi:hypothetical protein